MIRGHTEEEGLTRTYHCSATNMEIIAFRRFRFMSVGGIRLGPDKDWSRSDIARDDFIIYDDSGVPCSSVPGKYGNGNAAIVDEP